MPLIRRGTGVFFCIHIQRDFSYAHCSFASAPGVSQLSAEKVHQPNELQQNNETLLGYMSVKQTFLSCDRTPVSRHCAHGARPDRVIINKRTRNYEHDVKLPKKAIKAANCACMYVFITFQNVSQMHTKIQALVRFQLYSGVF